VAFGAPGKLVPGTTVSTALPIRQLVAGDVNGDGRPDLVAALSNGGPPQVFLNQGGAIFSPPLGLNTPPATTLALFDFDGDGALDLVGATQSPPGSFVARNVGGGTFQVAISLGMPGTLVAGVLFDSDPFGDILLANGAVLSLIRGAGPLVFLPSITVSVQPANIYAMATLDFDQDKNLDVLAATQAGLTLLRGTGGGTLAGMTLLPSPTSSVFAGDLNGDGLPDIAAATGGSVLALRNAGGGVFDPPSTIAASLPLPLTLVGAQLDGNARTDLVAGSSVAPTLSALINLTP